MPKKDRLGMTQNACTRATSHVVQGAERTRTAVQYVTPDPKGLGR